MKLMPHDRKHLFTKCMSVGYYPEATCPHWLKFLDDIFMHDAEMIHFIHKALGYSITGSVKEQCIFIMYGTGSNGKSTFCKHISKILGSYAVNISAAVLMAKQNTNIDPELHRLRGARFVTCAETGEGKKLSPAQVKQLTSDDTITAKMLYCEPFDFVPTGKIWMATNHKPNIPETDHGTWRRIKLIPFLRVISYGERDLQLDTKLESEYEGILAWMVRGCELWAAEGLGTCKAITECTEEYQSEQDIVGQFLNEQCEFDPSYMIQTSDIYEAYEQWCFKNGYKWAANQRRLGDYLKSKNYHKTRATSGMQKGCFFWYGITTKNQSNKSEGSEDIDKSTGRPY